MADPNAKAKSRSNSRARRASPSSSRARPEHAASSKLDALAHPSRALTRLASSAWLAPLALGLCLAACSSEKSPDPAPAPATSIEAPQSVAATTPPREKRLLDDISSCELHHRGLVLDFTDPNLRAYENFKLTNLSAPSFTERGALRLRKLEQSTSIDFWWGEATSTLELTGFVHALDSNRVTFVIDDKRLDTIKLKPGELQSVSLKMRELALTPGRHRLSIQLPKKSRRSTSLEIAWLRLGSEARAGETDQPPAHHDVLSEVTIGAERKRSVVLREGGSLRCLLWLPHASDKFVAQVGLWGQGRGEAEIVLREAGGKTRVLESVELTSEANPTWFPLDVDLGNVEGFVNLELRAPRLSRGARLAFGEPRLREAEPRPEKKAPHAERVFVVALAGLDREYSPPRASELGLPLLHHFAKEAAHFPGYRTTTTSSQGAIMSLLTGVGPRKHGVAELDASLARDVADLAETTQTKGVKAGMFTGVPTTFGVFGFDRGFEIFDAVSPVSDLSAIEPLRRARLWIEGLAKEPTPWLTVVHLRGAHPPFDVTRDAARELGPPEYGGDLDPRRAALQLAAIRARARPQSRRMPDEDWLRLAALRKRALADQDAALTGFFRFLRDRGLYNDALIVVTGDVGSGSAPLIPFDERAALSEDQLHVPLFVKFPGGHLAGRSISGLFGPEDLFATIADALGLELPEETIALGGGSAEDDAKERAHIASRGDAYATRLGPHLLVGTDGKPPRLCRVDLDPLCTLDRSNENPLAVQYLWLTTFRELARPQASAPAPTPTPLVLSEELTSALAVWGIER